MKKAEKNTIKIPGNLTIKNPLSGLIICEHCQQKMLRRPYKNGRQESIICTTSQCRNVSSDLNLVEKRIMQGIQNHLTKYKILCDIYSGSNIESIDDNKDVIKVCQKEIEKLRDQIAKACEMLENGT